MINVNNGHAMIHLKSVEFKENQRCFKKGDIFAFENVTLLVGDQGTGKSTLLELLAKNDNKLEISLTENTHKKGIKTFYFDSEKMNPRTKDPAHYGTKNTISFGDAIKSRFTSHGETLSLFTVEAIKKANDCVVFLDEPESGLSIRNQFKLINEIDNALERQCQLVIATHCLPLIQHQKHVLSLEHKKWISSDLFLNDQK
jgi:predicted ATPase